MNSYSDKWAQVQVLINCSYFVAQMCTPEDMPAHNLGAPYIDDVKSYNSLTTEYVSKQVYTFIDLIQTSFFFLQTEVAELGSKLIDVENQISSSQKEVHVTLNNLKESLGTITNQKVGQKTLYLGSCLRQL